MRFEELMKANETINTTPIKGKSYAQVHERIKAFRMLFPNGRIATEIIHMEDGIVYMKASIYDETEHLLGTGHAYEKEESSFINKTSYIENCETSAVGRALGMLGIGIDASFASYEEVKNAREQQEAEVAVIDDVKKKVIVDTIIKKNANTQKILERYKINSVDEMTVSMWVKAMQILNKMPDAVVE